MYHSWNLRRLLRYLALDTALVLAAVLLTHLGKHHFSAADSAGRRFASRIDVPQCCACTGTAVLCHARNAGVRPALSPGTRI